MKIFYLGPPSSFTHQAALKIFNSRDLISASSIEDVLDNVKINKSASVGIVPVENSKQGIVIRTLDLILQNKLKAIAEISLTIQQCLLSKEKTLKNIKAIYSHPHALAQAHEWIKKHVPQTEIKETDSTSKAAGLIQNLPNAAAVASKQAAEIYRLNILAKNIHQNKNNTTRFWIIGKRQNSQFARLPCYATHCGQAIRNSPACLAMQRIAGRQFAINTKTSLYIIIKDKVGALRDLLDIFAKNYINLTSIQSRPLANAPWKYGFFIDLLVDVNDPLAMRMFARLKKEHPKAIILGSYPQLNPEKFNSHFKHTADCNLKRINNIFSNNLNLDLIKKYVNKIKSPLILKNILIARYAVSMSIALYKYQHRQKIEDKNREQKLLRKMKKYDNLHSLYLKIIKNSKQLQQEIISLLKSKTIKPNDIISFKIRESRYYVDYLDLMAINYALISKSN